MSKTLVVSIPSAILILAIVAGFILAGNALSAKTALADHVTPGSLNSLNAGDYVIFSQAREGKAAETSDNGSNDIQASVSGSDNSIFGRIRSNADFNSSGQNINYHYVNNGSNPPVQPSTVNDGKITYRFLHEDGDNFYETPLSDPQHPGFTIGSWLPVQSDVPVGPVAPVVPDPYQLWPGNLSSAVTRGSDYLNMDTAVLEPFCDFGSLTDGAEEEFDLTNDSPNGTYCTDGGLIKVSVQNAGTKFDPKRFTFLANDGLITISGQNAFIEPFTLSLLAMTDLDSDSDQFPIKISGSDFEVLEQAIAFSSRSGVDMSGSDGSLLCVHAVGQEIKVQGSNSSFGPQAPDCESLGINVKKVANPLSVSNAGQLVNYSYTVTNNGNVPLINVALVDDVEGPIGIGTVTLQPGESTSGTTFHTMTQQEIDNVTLTNLATVTGESGSGQSVNDTDNQTVIAVEAPAITLVKTGSLNVGTDGIATPGDIITYSFAVTNGGNSTLTNVTISDPLVTVVGGPIATLAVGATDSTTFSGSYAISQADIDAGVRDNTATASGTPPNPTGATPPPADVTATSTHSEPITQVPLILVAKTPDLGDAGQPLNQAVGSTVVFTYEVTNDGNVALGSVAVSDNLPELVIFVSGDTDLDNELDVGETWTYTANHTVTQDDLEAGVIGTATDGAPGTAAASAVIAGGTAPASDTDPGGVTLLQSPAIGVAKTPDLGDAGQPLNQAVGSTVVFTYEVTNDGNVALGSLAVSDNLPELVIFVSGDTDLDNELDVGETWTYTANHTVTQADLDAGSIGTATDGAPGTAEASAVIAGGTAPASDTDPGGVTLLQSPAIGVVKTASVASISAPGTVTYNYTVINSGNVTLTNVTLDDDQEGAISLGVGPITLAPGATASGQSVHNVTQADIDGGSLVNVATATGTPSSGPNVTDTDTQTVTTPDAPAIQVLKTARATVINAGEIITYDYTVTNIGNVTLTGVTLVDDQEGTQTLSDVATDGIGVLAVGDSETASSTHVVTQADIYGGDLVNVATATGTPPVGLDVTDTDTRTVTTPDNPLIQVAKTASVTSVSNDGETITYDYTVTNLGNVTLTNVTLSDDQEGPITLVGQVLPITLAPGASISGSSVHDVTQADIDGGDLVNVATATGTPPSGVDVSASDTQTVTTPDNPSIDLVKAANVATVNNAGDTVTYDYTVTNTGNVTLNNVTLFDDIEGPISLGVGPITLAPGASVTVQSVHNVTQPEIDAGDLVNVATATGTPPNGPSVVDIDTRSVTTPDAPSIGVVKTASVASISGPGPVTYDYTVTNTGNVTLNNVTLNDDQEGAISLGVGPITLAPGATASGQSVHDVTQAEIDGGSLVNVATATGTPPSGVDVSATDTQTVTTPDTPSIGVVKTASVASISGPGPVTYDYTVTNTGNVTLNNVTLNNVTLNDDQEGAISLGVGPITLAPGATASGQSVHDVTQAEIDGGSLVNVATATGTPPSGVDVSATDTQTVTTPDTPSIGVVKTASVASISGPGPVTYDYTVTNLGNVTLNNVTLNDDQEGAISLGVGPISLAPGATASGQSVHDVTQAEIDGGSLVNVATATGTPPSGVDVSATDTQTVTTPDTPSIGVVKTASVASISGPGPVTYDYTVTNLGNVTLNNVTLNDDQEGAISLGVGPITLAPGATASGQSVHDVTQAEIDGGSLVNVATATGTPPSGVDVSATDTQTVTTPDTPSIGVVKTAAALEDTNLDGAVGAVGDDITFTYDVENTGNVTLTNVTVIDDNGTPLVASDDITVTLSAATLAPGAQAIGTATHTITLADIANGSFTNVGLATGEAPAGNPTDPTDDITDDDPETVNFVNLSLAKSVGFQDVFASFTNNATVGADLGSDASGSITNSVRVATDIIYTITVTNSGDANATGVTITDTLPTGVTVDNASISDGGTASNGIVTWTGLTVLANSNISVSVTVQTTN